MRWLPITIFLSFGLPILACVHPEHKAPANLEPTGLRYEISPAPEGSRALQVKLTFEAGEQTVTYLRLPNESSGQSKLYEAIRILHSTSNEVKLAATDRPQIKRIQHPAHARITLQYQVIQEREGSLSTDERYYRAIVQKNYFHLLGEMFFVYPEVDPDQPRKIELLWQGFPADWNLANSFGAQESEQVLHRSIAEFRHAIFIGGDFRLQKTEVKGQPIWIALHGKFGFTDTALAELVARIIRAERGFFNDFDFPYFLITALAVDPQCCYTSGTGLTDSFATFLSDGTPIDASLIHLLTHELFHTWNGRKIKRQDPEELVYWFSEGFTNYYARLLSLRAGLLDLPGYIADVNEMLKRYHLSAVKNYPNRKILDLFWKDAAVGRLPYQRGDLLALRWNARIKGRQEGKRSLDDFMHSLLKEAQEKNSVVSATTVQSLLSSDLPNEVTADLAKYIDRGETLEPEPGALGPCVSLLNETHHPYDPGFDEKASTENRVVMGVKPGGPAWRAGLRNGQSLLSWSIQHDPKVESRLDTQDQSGVESEISFYPEGPPVQIIQYILDKKRFEKDSRKCLEWFN